MPRLILDLTDEQAAALCSQLNRSGLAVAATETRPSGPTLLDLRTALVNRVKRTDTQEAIAKLKELSGVTVIPDVPESRFAEVIAGLSAD